MGRDGELSRLTKIALAAEALFDQRVSPMHVSPPPLKWFTLAKLLFPEDPYLPNAVLEHFLSPSGEHREVRP
jgi:hypothetical protein